MPIAAGWRARQGTPNANTDFSVAIPSLVVASINAKLRWDAHWEHVAHDTPKEDKPEYAYQNIRTKNYFWGDGDKV
jgi:cytochrome c oxidase subunit 6a